jgi:hypothetical protein
LRKQKAESRKQKTKAPSQRRGWWLFCLLPSAFCFLLSCAAPPPAKPQLVAPQWDAIPPGVLDTLCNRLRMDAIATGAPLAIVGTTRALANQQSLSALAFAARSGRTTARAGTSVTDANRAIEVVTAGSSCAWKKITPDDAARLYDEMIVELSAPALHPFSSREAGLFARVSLGGQGASWYWISLHPAGDRWAVGSVVVLSQ